MAAPARVDVKPMALSVLGAGAWGTALAATASHRVDVRLWGRDAVVVNEINTEHRNARYLPEVQLPNGLLATSDLRLAIEHVTEHDRPGLIVLGTPMAGLRAISEAIKPFLAHSVSKPGIVWTCKGLVPDTAELPHEVMADLYQSWPDLAQGVLSGPSFAREVAQGLPVALTIASTDASLRAQVTQAFHGGNVRIYGSSDVIGVEVGGALKNIMAIACGIADGLALGSNARAALITRGLAEMVRFGVALGAHANTFSGLTGLGDLVLTATGELSRNRQVGLQIGQGRTLEAILAQGLTAEGARCAKAVLRRAQSLGVDMPITDSVCQILFEHVPVKEAVALLMSRDATQE
jgi:glycerol-3-phosphate dehydrogenase (NAD(P)+)